MQDSHNEKWSLPLRTQHKVPYGRKVSDNLRSKITYIKKTIKVLISLGNINTFHRICHPLQSMLERPI